MLAENCFCVNWCWDIMPVQSNQELFVLIILTPGPLNSLQHLSNNINERFALELLLHVPARKAQGLYSTEKENIKHRCLFNSEHSTGKKKNETKHLKRCVRQVYCSVAAAPQVLLGGAPNQKLVPNVFLSSTKEEMMALKRPLPLPLPVLPRRVGGRSFFCSLTLKLGK